MPPSTRPTETLTEFVDRVRRMKEAAPHRRRQPDPARQTPASRHTAGMPGPTSHYRVEIRLRELKQLFNSMDPAPFIEKDLDADAEQFIVESAEEHPLDQPIELVVHLATPTEDSDPNQVVRTAIHHYFRARTEYARLAFRRLMRQGQASLLIGTVFLATCFTGAELIDEFKSTNRWLLLLREGLIIAGWVAMWRPMEIYLYDWWPLHRKLKLMRKLSRMPVKVVLPKTPPVNPTSETTTPTPRIPPFKAPR